MPSPTPYLGRHTVRFHEIDRAGIVYFGRVYEYCHVVYEDMLADALGGSLEEHFRTSTWGMPLVHSHADYQRPMLLGDPLEIALEVGRLGGKSITFDYTIRAADGGTHATVQLIHAFVRLSDFAPLPVPDELRTSLIRLGLIPG